MGQGMGKGTGGAAGTAAELAVGFGSPTDGAQQGGISATGSWASPQGPQAPELMGLPEAAKYLFASHIQTHPRAVWLVNYTFGARAQGPQYSPAVSAVRGRKQLAHFPWIRPLRPSVSNRL
jgi:hypothetical protein